jgi:hypothetical protein
MTQREGRIRTSIDYILNECRELPDKDAKLRKLQNYLMDLEYDMQEADRLQIEDRCRRIMDLEPR